MSQRIHSARLATSGPPSNPSAYTPSGASHTSPAIRQPYVAEHTFDPFGSSPPAYTVVPASLSVLGGMSGIAPAATAAFRDAVHAAGILDASGCEAGYVATHAASTPVRLERWGRERTQTRTGGADGGRVVREERVREVRGVVVPLHTQPIITLRTLAEGMVAVRSRSSDTNASESQEGDRTREQNHEQKKRIARRTIERAGKQGEGMKCR
jgi:hypothetical protein